MKTAVKCSCSAAHIRRGRAGNFNASLADVRHQWPGRHTEEGQGALVAMRDAIAKATGREAQTVQDEAQS